MSAVISIRYEFEIALVPRREGCLHLGVTEPEAVLHHGVGLGDQLHVGVFDAVVQHLDEMAGAVRPEAGAARRGVDLGGDRLEDRLHARIGFGRTARHDRWPVARALLAAGDAGAEQAQPALAERALTADSVLVTRIAAIDDHVAGREQRG